MQKSLRSSLTMGNAVWALAVSCACVVPKAVAKAATASLQDCDAVLSHVHDTTATRWTFGAGTYSAFAEEFCQQDSSGKYTGTDSSKSTDAGLQVGIPFGELPLNFGGHSRGNGKDATTISSTYRQALCSYLASTAAGSLKQDLKQILNLINTEVIQACKLAHKCGLRVFVEPRDDAQHSLSFNLEVMFTACHGAPNPRVTHVVVPAGVQCEGALGPRTRPGLGDWRDEDQCVPL